MNWDEYEELYDFFNYEQDDKDPDQELLDAFEDMLQQIFPEEYAKAKDEEEPVEAKKEEDVCEHRWKKIPGFMSNSFYEVCEICGIDKDD